MKKNLMCLFLLALLLIGGVDVYAKLNLKEMDYLSKVQLLNNRLKYELVIDVKNRSGDLDYEFLKQFRNHQRIMIELAQNEIQYGEDDEIKEIAQDIVREKKVLLDKVEKMLKDMESNLVVDKVKESAYFVAYDEVYQQLLERIKSKDGSESVVSSRGVDRDFLGRILMQYEVMSEMLTLIETFSDSEAMLQFVVDTLHTSQTRLGNLYELVNQIDEKKDDSQ